MACNTNPKTCSICQHPERAEIERLILSVSPSNPALTLAVIADAYNVSVEALRVHTLMHTPLALDFSAESEAALIDNFKSRAGVASGDATSHPSADSDSGSFPKLKDRLADKVNVRESDMLLASATEMLTTLSTLSRRITSYASDGSDGSDQRLAAFCSPALVNLYVNASAELRKNIDAISKLNLDVNGEKDSGNDGLKALAAALAGSVNNRNKQSTEDNESEVEE